MSLKIVNSAGVVINTAGIELPASAAVITEGDAVMRVTSSNAVARATSSAAPADANTGLFGIATKSATATDLLVEVVPFIYGMLIEIDCTSATVDTDILKRLVLTDHDHLANASADSTANEGCFLYLASIGATSEKRALVMYVGAGNQVNA